MLTQRLRSCHSAVLWAVRGARSERAACRRGAASQASAEGALQLTDSCVEKLRRVGVGRVLRVSVEGGGCSGFQYRFQLEDQPAPDDVLFERDGARVVVDSASLDLLRGATLDYHEELIRSAFRIVDNPQAERGCSCGASFTIKL
ncbi:iron-sulfur cluster assembly 2 homolog, mitochondrial [Dermacentor andersoni]|uniref:iron-sulfur cluster assembly 2 homolog, mitochondrial n=1 Tax=Dermacentor andersoni TaxID=34620 RepID=UPI002155BAF1|nr:iron-sulfur cluster assembly 2 homolog, mitochondrial-like [Dermacentor andersoni]